MAKKSPNKVLDRSTGRIKDSIHAQRYKYLRDNNDITWKIDLRKPLTRSQQKKIKRYFDLSAEIRSSSTPMARYSGRNKKEVAKLTGQNLRLKGFNGVLYPKYTDDSKLGFDNEGAFVKTGKLKITTHFFDFRDLDIWGSYGEDADEAFLEYAIAMVEQELKPRKNHIAFYRMLTGGGAYETQNSYDTYDTARLLRNWFNKYGAGNRNPGQTPDNWLVGVRRTEFPLKDLKPGQATLMRQEAAIAEGKRNSKRRYRAVLKEAENARKRKKNKRNRR